MSLIDEAQIDLVISGLKGLYEKLAVREKQLEGDAHPEERTALWFESEKDRCLQSLKELFLHRMKEHRERRIKQNAQTVALRSVNRAFWVNQICSYLELEDCFNLAGVCVYFQ